MAKDNRGGRRGGNLQPVATSGLMPDAVTSAPTLEQYLGDAGTPRTPQQALATVNPNYSPWGDPKWRKNCQRCAWAYEMQRRGYDVEALPNLSDPSTGYIDQFGNRNKNPDGTWKHENYSQIAKGDLQWSKELGTIWGQYYGGSPASADSIKNEIKSYGNNRRGFLAMKGLAGRKAFAHVINWETDSKGNVKFYDAQDGKAETITNLKKKGFNQFQVARTDNVEVTDLIRKAVKRRGT